MRDRVLSMWRMMERGEVEYDVGSLMDMRAECYNTIRNIAHGESLKKVVLHESLLRKINSKITEKFGDWIDK